MQELNIMDTAVRNGIFQTFTRLMEGSRLEQKLRSQELFTLFAPVDIAFAYLSPDTFKHLLRAENQGNLSDVLGYHAVTMKIMSHELKDFSKAKTVYGSELSINCDQELRVDGARLVHLDIVACNGVIHGIDRLLIPAMSAAAASR